MKGRPRTPSRSNSDSDPQPEPAPPVDANEPPTFGQFLLAVTRIFLPAVIAIAGVALLVIGHGSYSATANTHSLESAAGVALLIVALMVWLLNWLFRLSVSSNRDREQEERAREYFDRTGHWPDEPGDADEHELMDDGLEDEDEEAKPEDEGPEPADEEP